MNYKGQEKARGEEKGAWAHSFLSPLRCSVVWCGAVCLVALLMSFFLSLQSCERETRSPKIDDICNIPTHHQRTHSKCMKTVTNKSRQ